MKEYQQHPLTKLTRNLTRDRQIVICYQAGNTIFDIVKAFQLSQQRVWQILQKANVTRDDNPVTRNRKLYAHVGLNLRVDVKAAMVAECARRRTSLSAYMLSLVEKDLIVERKKPTIPVRRVGVRKEKGTA